jgi:hypothetical protein
MGTYSFTGSIQKVTVGAGGTYDITAYGARGGSGSGGQAGGSGAEYGGNFNLTAGEKLEVVTGGAGAAGTGTDGGGGGGGGSFVLANTGAGGSYQLLLAAGGGGGGAQAAPGGAGGYSSPGGGSGGGETSGHSGGGSGHLSDGGNNGGTNITGGYTGGSGAGYPGITHPGNGGNGGFGGGGGGGYSTTGNGITYQGGGGGGGGYSGGQGGSIGYGSVGAGAAGGGGTSFDSASAPLVAGSAATENTANNSNGLVTITPSVTCYCRGTLIRTAHGEKVVEELKIGDLLVTASGAHRPIRWLGHRRTDCRNHPRPNEVMPVSIAAHAFGPDKPVRDLFVSPGHSICIDLLGEVLIPACALVNGTTIRQLEVDEVTYWHVELDSHDIIFAENLPAESYLEMDNRRFFQENDVTALDAVPDADAATRTHADFCRSFHDHGPFVDVARAQLRARALVTGWMLVEGDRFAGLHLIVDGMRIEPACRGLVAYFNVPAGAHDVWLVSATARPSEVYGTPDGRDLGVCVRSLMIDDGFEPPLKIDLADPLLCIGFHALEDGLWRWTAGQARLPALWAQHGRATDDGFFLRVELANPALPRWVASPADASRRVPAVSDGPRLALVVGSA